MLLSGKSITGSNDESKSMDSTAKYLQARLGNGFDFSLALSIY